MDVQGRSAVMAPPTPSELMDIQRAQKPIDACDLRIDTRVDG